MYISFVESQIEYCLCDASGHEQGAELDIDIGGDLYSAQHMTTGEGWQKGREGEGKKEKEKKEGEMMES